MGKDSTAWIELGRSVHQMGTVNAEPYRERVARTPFTPMERFFFTAMAARGASQKFPEVAANTCSAIEMQQNKPFATHF